MAEENKLVYYVEINTEKGIEDALKKLEGFNKKAQATLKGITGKSSANTEIDGLKKQLDGLSKAWDDYNIAQRKGASGSETLKSFKDINNEAGIYAGNIRQVVKAQNEQSESATVVYKMLQALRKEFRGLGEEQLKDPKVLQEYVNRFNEIKSISEAAGLSIDQYVGKLQKQSVAEEKLAIKQEELAKKMATVIGQRDALNKKFRDMTPELQMGTAGQNVLSQMAELNTQYGHLFKSASQIVQEQDKLNASKQREIEFLNTTEGKYAKLEALWKDLAASQKSGKLGSQLVAQMEALDAVYKETDISLRKYTDTVVRSREEEEKKAAILSTYAGQVGALSDAWNRLTIAERKGKEGQELITQFDKLKNDAGVYAGSLEQVAASQKKLATGTANANKQFSLQSKILMQLKAQMGMYLSTYALIRFAKNVRDITGEFELQRVSLAAILQDKAEADKIFGQIVDLALQSPFRIKDITSYTKQLAAYRIETDKLFDTTKRLADISAGLGVDMDRLVLAYGQVRAASVLRGQELRQFTEAGIPLVQLLADKFTKLNGEMVSTGEVFSLISQRAVPFRMIEEIFNDMTDAGGIFYDMQKTQAQTIKGVWANLADAYDKMYYEIGQKNEGLLKGLGNFLRGLADNWETVYNGLSAVTAGYVAYLVVSKLVTKSTMELTAAQLANIAADGKAVFTRLSLTHTTAYATKVSNAYMAAQYKLAASTNFLSKAFYKLWSAILLNPIAAAVAVIVGLGVAIGGAVIKANSLDSIIKRLNKSTAEYKTLTEDVGGAIKIFNKLNGAVGNTEEETKKLNDATSLLAERYPSARQNVDGYSNSVKIAADKVNELYQAELKLRNLLLEKDYNALLQKEENLKNKIAFLDERIARANASGDLSEGKKLIWEKDKFVKDLEEASKTLDQWYESLYGGKRGGRATPKDLFGIQDYVNRIKSIFKHPTTGKDIKLYDSKEDIQAFTTETELLEDIAKKYKAAATEAEYYAKKKNNPEIEAADRANAANSELVYRAEMKLAHSALERYDSLGLISDFLKKNSKDEVDILYDQINTAKDARAAYEGYLKVMNEVRAKQTVEDQLKFAGIRFDVADSGSYKQYLLDVYNRIKNDPNYEKVRTLIEDTLVDFDLKSIETELKNKLEKISNDIAKTQKANEFFEKILGLTGDIELSKKLTIKYTGTAAGDTAQGIKEQLQKALDDVLGKDSMDISAMSVKEISELIDTIPETMSEGKGRVKQFFDMFVENGNDAAVKMAELDNVLKELNLDDSMLFGTGVTLDVQKIVRDLSVGNKKLADERTRLETDIANDKRAKDKTWYNEQMKFIANAFKQRAANEKVLAQDKLNDLAKAYVEERLFQEGISDLLQDVGDKTYAQLSRARKMLQSISDTDLIKISDEGMARIESLGYTIDDLMQMESIEQVFANLGEGFSYADEQLIALLFSMNSLGLSAEQVEKLIGEILSGKVSNARVEELKKLSSTVNELSSGIAGILNDSLDLFAGDAPWVDGVQQAIDGFAKLTSAAVELGTEIARAAGELGEATSTVGGGVAAGGGGIAGAIIAIVGAVIQIGAAIAQVVQSLNQAAIDEAINDINDKVEKLKLNLENISKITGIGDGWFTDDAFQGVRNINDQINLLIKNLRDLTTSYNGSILASNTTRDEWYKTYFGDLDREPEVLDWFERYLGEIGAMLKKIPSNIASVDIGSIFRDLDLDALSKLKKELEQLDLEGTNEALRDSVVERIALLEQAFTDMREAVRNILGDISGKMLDTVIEKWDEIRESGIDAFGGIEGAASHMAESVKKDVAGMIKDMVAQQLWAATMSKYFDTLGEDLTQAILGGASPTDMLPIFNTFWEGMKEGLVNYTTAWDAFLNTAESAGWNMRGGGTADDFAPGSISELNDQLSKLEEQWDNMSQAEREAAAGLQLWNDILAKREEVEAAESYYEYANKLDEAVGKYDDLIEKATYLKSVVDSLSEGGEKKYAQSLLDATNAEIYASLYAEYLPDTVKFQEELDNINKNLQWAIENGYPELAKWIQAAYDTTVLDKWKEAVDETISGADSDLQKFNIVVKMLQEAEAELLNTIISGGDGTEVTNHIAYLQGVLGDLRKDIKDGIWSDYATDAQKYEQELVDMNKDLEWAIRNYPELADEISDAFNTSVLKNWQDAWDDAFADFDTSFQKWQAIQQELGNLGAPSITKNEAIKGRDAALVEMGKYKEGTSEYATAKAAYDYYQAQLILHMKINELLIQQADIEDELYDKYRSNEQEYADDIAERKDDIKTLEGIRDQFAPDTKEWEKWNEVVMAAKNALAEFVSDYNLDGLTEEFESTFGDITDLSTKKVKEMLEAFREQILSSDLSEEAKKEALALIDDIYDQLDNRTQEAFDNIQSAINSLSSILESFGADENIINSFKGIETAIGGVAQIVTGVVSGKWFKVLAGIAKLISGFINAIKSLITFFKGDPLAGLEAIATTVTNAQNAVEKAIGTAKSQEQKNLVNTYAQAMAQIDEAISSESGKKDTRWTRFWGTAPDDEAIEKLKEQRAEYEKLMEEAREAMKSDFLQTDYISFSDALADILIKPWDSYMEMMEAVKELTDNTINDIVKHALSLQLQQQVNAALESLYKRGISDQSLDKFDEDIENIVAGYSAYQEALGKYFTGDVGSSTAYDTISRITEAQANSFLGYYQNYLIIMTDMSNVLKRIFDSMSKISVNVNLDGYLNTLQAIATNTALTARNTAFIEGMAADIKTLKNSMTRSGAY